VVYDIIFSKGSRDQVFKRVRVQEVYDGYEEEKTSFAINTIA
jgi:hypothetical protein